MAGGFSGRGRRPAHRRGALPATGPARRPSRPRRRSSLTSAAALTLLGPEHVFTTEVVRAGAEQDRPGRGRRPLPDSRAPAAGAAGRAARCRRWRRPPRRPCAEGRASPRSPSTTTPRCSPARPGTRRWPEPLRRPGDPRLRALGGRGPARPGCPRARGSSDPARAAAKAFADALREAGHRRHPDRGRVPARAHPAGRASRRPRWSRSSSAAAGQRQRRAPRCCCARSRWPRTGPAAGRGGRRRSAATLDRLGVWPDDARPGRRQRAGPRRRGSRPTPWSTCCGWPPRPRTPSCGPLLTGLPVAGVEGSLRVPLRRRRRAAPARGVVRGQDGHADRGARPGGLPARPTTGPSWPSRSWSTTPTTTTPPVVWLDRVSAALGRCGC